MGDVFYAYAIIIAERELKMAAAALMESAAAALMESGCSCTDGII